VAGSHARYAPQLPQRCREVNTLKFHVELKDISTGATAEAIVQSVLKVYRKARVMIVMEGASGHTLAVTIHLEAGQKFLEVIELIEV
jgi:hypothetical protein